MAPEFSGNTTGDFNPFGPKEPTPGRRKRKPPRFEFLGAIGLLLGIFGLLGFLIFKPSCS